MNKKHYTQNKKCLGCNKIIVNKAVRCKSCNNKYLRKIGIIDTSGKNHPGYKGKIGVICKKCNREFEVSVAREKVAKFCSKKCFYEFKRIILECKNCRKKFKVKRKNKNRFFCSLKCVGEYRRGVKHFNWMGGRTKCIDCRVLTSNYNSIRCDACYRKWNKNSNHYNWQGGISFEPYSIGWNKTFKEQIRYRDGYKCQICGCPEIENRKNLSIHHRDYDKKNLQMNNLISLCKSCHMKTNFNREYWLGYFTNQKKNEKRKERTYC